MAKKNPAQTNTAPARAPRKRSNQPVAPVDVAGTTAPAPIAEASDKAVPRIATTSDTPDEAVEATPSYDDIARVAYEKYLSRGGDHGRDFDDWLEAEKALRSRK